MAGELSDAVTVLHRAVTECEQFRGPQHPDTLRAAQDELARPTRPLAMPRRPPGC